MSTSGIILSIALAGAGGTKVTNVGPHEEEFPRYNLPAIDAQMARSSERSSWLPLCS